MTIAAAYLTSEGVVLGTDSTTTVQGPGGEPVQLFDHAQKLFELGPPGHGRMAACTWGTGSLGEVSHRTVLARVADSISEETSVTAAADTLVDEAKVELERSGARQLVGYFLGGHDLPKRLPACKVIQLQCREEGAGVAVEAEVADLKIGEARFAGSHEFFGRVFRGYDPLLKQGLRQLLLDKHSISAEDFDTLFEETAAPLVLASYGDIPIREAIDYVHTYLHLTIKAYKFRYGAPICGGPIEIGFITTDRRFRWASHKGFRSALIEEEPGAHEH